MIGSFVVIISIVVNDFTILMTAAIRMYEYSILNFWPACFSSCQSLKGRIIELDFSGEPYSRKNYGP